MFILLAVLAFIGFAFGMKALRTVVLTGAVVVALYFAAALHTLAPNIQRAVDERQQAAALEAHRPPPDRSPAPKCPDDEHLAWISTENVTELRPVAGEREHWECVGGLHQPINQRHARATAMPSAAPAPTALEPAPPPVQQTDRWGYGMQDIPWDENQPMTRFEEEQPVKVSKQGSKLTQGLW